MQLKNMKIRDEMTTGITTVGIDAPVSDAINTMAKNDISSVVVVYPNGTGAGVISSFDIVTAFSEKTPREVKEMTTDDLMTDVITMDPEQNLEEALKLMVKEKIHRVVVLSSSQAGRKPIGVLSATDMVKKLRKL
jgi:CBS domain-containing protein